MADEAKSRGNAAFSAGNFAEAITHFTDAINLSPTNHILYSNRSAAHASLSNFTQALIDAEKTVELKPDWSKGYSRLGAAFMGLQSYTESISSYEKGLEIDPDNDALKSGLARAKLALERTNLSQKQKDLRDSLNCTKSTEELVKIFEEMETCIDDKAMLAVDCHTIAQALIADNRREDVRIFIKKMNKITLGNDKCSSGNTCFLDDDYNFLFAKSANVLGSSCLDAKKYDAGLQNLNLANMILTTKFENDENSVCEGKCVLRALAFNLYLLHKVTRLMGKVVDSAVHGKKCLEVKEKLMEEGCHGLALANMDVFFAYGTAMMFKEALPYGWKALEIHMKNKGSGSLEVAKMRENLAFMYCELGDYEKAREQEELAKMVPEIRESPDEMINAGRYEEAIALLEGSLSRDDVTEDVRAMDYISMANAYFKMGKFPDSKKHLRSAEEIFEKCPRILNQSLFMMIYIEISELYEKIGDIEAAISFLKKVTGIPDLSQDLFSQAASRFFSLVAESGKTKELIPDMLDLVEKLKVIFSPEHRHVGYGYGHLGLAYWDSGHRELAVKFTEDAKSILDATIGRNHINALKTSHTLSEFYGEMGRYALALEIERNVVKDLKGLPPGELGFMHEVNKHLSKMKERVAESPTTVSSQSRDLGISAKMSKCDISDDGKGTT